MNHKPAAPSFDSAFRASLLDLFAWRRDVRRLTGNPVEVLEVGADEATRKLGGRSQVWADIRRDGRVVHGVSIDELRAAHVG